MKVYIVVTRELIMLFIFAYDIKYQTNTGIPELWTSIVVRQPCKMQRSLSICVYVAEVFPYAVAVVDMQNLWRYIRNGCLYSKSNDLCWGEIQ